MKCLNGRVSGYQRHLSLVIAMGLLSECSSPRPAVTSVPSLRGDIIFPEIVPSAIKHSTSAFKHVFTFEGEQLTISVKVDGAVLAGARAAEKVTKMTEVAPRLELDAGLRWALISDPAQSPLYDDLVAAFQKIRSQKGLDTDRYAELIVAFVQSIEYCSSVDAPLKYPIETVADACGDCDDKSLLMAALLNHEDYDVSLFTFHAERHMAVGIRSTDSGFLNSGYAYIETTSPSYIGFPSYEYSDVKLSSVPDLVVLGEKPKRWTKGDQVRFLFETLRQEREHARTLTENLDKLKAENEALKSKYNRLRLNLKRAKGNVSTQAYNKLVDETNRLGSKLNQAADNYNGLVQKLNQSNSIAAYIFDHPDNRQGVYQWIVRQLNADNIK